MKKQLRIIFIVLSIFYFYSNLFCLETIDEKERPWHLLEQAKRIEQAHGELDGRMWSPENWAK